jgi:putative addiction module component (TIGR02574 family)
MVSALEQITRDAMGLPVHERLVLAHQLIDSAEHAEREEDEASPAWESEIQDRIRAIDEGRAVGSSYEAVQQEVAKLAYR